MVVDGLVVAEVVFSRDRYFLRLRVFTPLTCAARGFGLKYLHLWRRRPLWYPSGWAGQRQRWRLPVPQAHRLQRLGTLPFRLGYADA